MPEIAEVETVRNTLKNKILNKRIKNVNIIYSKMIESDLNTFENILQGKSIIDINRIGKWLLFDLGEYCLLSHLRMEGKFFLKTNQEAIEKHEHIIITFEDDSELRYHDTRKFGKMNLVKKDELANVEGIAKQGYEPFDKKLTAQYLLDKFKKKSLPIKSVLLDQTIISGLGNIYADEVLFGARIYPLKRAKDITSSDANNIIKSSIEVIDEAIKLGGTTIKSYTSSLGVTGMFQQKLMVHSRYNEACKVCNTNIKRIKVGGRSTYYCEKCQVQ